MDVPPSLSISRSGDLPGLVRVHVIVPFEALLPDHVGHLTLSVSQDIDVRDGNFLHTR